MLDFVDYLSTRGIGNRRRITVTGSLCPGEFLGFCALAFVLEISTPGSATLPLRLPMKKTARNASPRPRHFHDSRYLLCSLNSPQCRPKNPAAGQVDNIEAMDRISRRCSRMLVLSHLGNMGIVGQLMPKFVGYVRNASVYQKLGNRFIDGHVRRTRGQRLGIIR